MAKLGIGRGNGWRFLRSGVLWILAASAVSGACGSRAESPDLAQAALHERLTSGELPPYARQDPEGRTLWTLTRQFYEGRAYAPAWLDGTAPRRELGHFIEALGAAIDEGLDPELYNLGLLTERYERASKGWLTKAGFDPEEAGALETWVTYLYLKYASDLAQGLSDLARADKDWHIKPQEFNPAAHLEHALTEGNVKRSLLDLLPSTPHYHALRSALGEYRKQAQAGGWPAVPATAKLKPGQKSPHVAALARRLAASGEFQGTLPEGETSAYAADLQEAVKRFQRRHGLPDDGVVGPGTVAALNVPVEVRIRQIELNLERWRWLPRELGERYILVNIPEYRLEVWEGERVALAMRTVVGRQDTPTPIFNGEVSYIVFSPYWYVPPDIAAGETLPAVMRDPGFLERNNMEVIDARGNPVDPSTVDFSDPKQYKFRQRPGAQNSLGLVKFMFPNQHHVYLHDTPVDSLFARAARSFSHGCVRLEEPRALAEYLLRDQPEWDAPAIEQAMHAGEERAVNLTAPVPIYLGYWTARVSADGELQFRQDVYGTDRRQVKLLEDRLARLRKAAGAAAAALPAPAAKP